MWNYGEEYVSTDVCMTKVSHKKSDPFRPRKRISWIYCSKVISPDYHVSSLFPFCNLIVHLIEKCSFDKWFVQSYHHKVHNWIYYYFRGRRDIGAILWLESVNELIFFVIFHTVKNGFWKRESTLLFKGICLSFL